MLIINNESVIRVNKKYYPQTLLEECKYVIRKNKMENLINDDLDLSSPDDSDNETDNETDNEIDSDESSDSQNGVIHSRLLLLLKHHLIF